ncbi:hypothetical protein [Lactobacillus sp. PSON]|uniref:hypothetical protein n=1 Tax=Lactobacillus sp. PSON TaxID=3455454 RepID=UPI0040430D00
MASESQRKANKRYKEKHKEQQQLYVKRSTTRNFLKNYASLDDLQEMQEIIDTRLKQLENK